MPTLPCSGLPRHPIALALRAYTLAARVGSWGQQHGQRLLLVLALLATFGTSAAFESGAKTSPLAQSVLVASLTLPQPLCGGGPTPCPMTLS